MTVLLRGSVKKVCLAAAAGVTLGVLGLFTLVGQLVGDPEGPAPLSARMHKKFADVSEQLRNLQRRSRLLSPQLLRGSALRERLELTPLRQRLQAAEGRLASLHSDLSQLEGDLLSACLRMSMQLSMLRNEQDPAVKLVIMSDMSSNYGGSALASAELASQWLEIAQAIGDDRARELHFLSARHIAPWSRRVRDHLVATALFGRDQKGRLAAMTGLQNCYWEDDLIVSMQTISRSPAAGVVRGRAREWLESARRAGAIQ